MLRFFYIIRWQIKNTIVYRHQRFDDTLLSDIANLATGYLTLETGTQQRQALAVAGNRKSRPQMTRCKVLPPFFTMVVTLTACPAWQSGKWPTPKIRPIRG